MNNMLSLSTLLNLPPILRVRRNHALEHATMHVLSERYRDLKLVARSSLWGFYIYGNIPAEAVLAAAQEALQRLKAGQREIAIHPNCGSNLVVAGTLAGLGAFLALSGGRKAGSPGKTRAFARWLEHIARLPLACAAAMLGIVLAQPLGIILQARVTTQSDVGDLRIISVTQEKKAGIFVHHVRTGG